MNELETCFSEYFIYFGEVMNYWNSVNNKISEILRPISNQTEQLRLCSRAQLDDGFLKKFPDVKEKLVGKIHSNIEEEFIALYKVQGEIKTLVDGLKIRLTSVEKAYLKHDPGEDKEFNPLNPGNESLLEYAGDSWGCFHILWVGVKTAIETVDYFEKESITNISDAFLKYKQVQTHLQDILDLTYYLRTS